LAYNAERVVAEKLGRETVTYCSNIQVVREEILSALSELKEYVRDTLSGARPYRHVGVCSQRRSGGVKERVDLFHSHVLGIRNYD